jgi:hypothetical protein
MNGYAQQQRENGDGDPHDLSLDETGRRVTEPDPEA